MSTFRLKIEAGSENFDVDEGRLPYVSKRHLGRGGSSVVDKVQDLNTNLVYARKICKFKQSEKTKQRRIFENEINVIRSLEKHKQHHHMIRCHATYTTVDTLAMLLDPVADSGDLGEYLEQYNLESPGGSNHAIIQESLKQAFGCLAGGLAFLHERNVRHKDIKKGNILVHQNRVLYADFGFSFDSSNLENSTTTGPTHLTRRYAAPEVLASRDKNSASDVWSLGCVFIEIIAALTSIGKDTPIEQYSDSIHKIHSLYSFYGSYVMQNFPDIHFLISVTQCMTQRQPNIRWKAFKVWEECSRRKAFRCDECWRSPPLPKASVTPPVVPREHNGPRPSASLTVEDNHGAGIHHSKWKWSEQYGRYYRYVMGADNQILHYHWAPEQPREAEYPSRVDATLL
jgi:serine/threonine protein kinase